MRWRTSSALTAIACHPSYSDKSIDRTAHLAGLGQYGVLALALKQGMHGRLPPCSAGQSVRLRVGRAVKPGRSASVNGGFRSTRPDQIRPQAKISKIKQR